MVYGIYELFMLRINYFFIICTCACSFICIMATTSVEECQINRSI